jgi:ParB family chromosome partitioning protein
MESSLSSSEPSGKKLAIAASRGQTTFKVEPERLLIVGHDTPHKSKAEHPLFQQRALEAVDEALAANMAENGFTTVIDVRKDGPNLEVVVGRRRVKAARRANEIRAAKGLGPIKVVCQVVKGSDIAVVKRMISENALHQDVPVLVMAEDLQGLIDMGASEAEAALAAGKSVPQLRQILKLLDLDASVQAAIRDNIIPPSVGIKMAELTRDDQKAELGRHLAGEKTLTAAHVASTVRAKRNGTEAVQAPGRRVLKQLIEHEESVKIFGEDGIKALRYAMGDLSPRQFAGLTDLLRQLKG